MALNRKVGKTPTKPSTKTGSNRNNSSVVRNNGIPRTVGIRPTPEKRTKSKK